MAKNKITNQQFIDAARGLRFEDPADVFTRGTEVRFADDPAGEYSATVLGPCKDGFAVGWIDDVGEALVDVFLATQLVTGTRNAKEWIVTEDSRVSLASSGPCMIPRGHRVYDAGTAAELTGAGVKLRAVS
jgi:hypothetical protein